VRLSFLETRFWSLVGPIYPTIQCYYYDDDDDDDDDDVSAEMRESLVLVAHGGGTWASERLRNRTISYNNVS
jgi:hypothetical protein